MNVLFFFRCVTFLFITEVFAYDDSCGINYNLKFKDIFTSDLSDICDGCIVLTGLFVMATQSFNAWCHKPDGQVYYANTSCQTNMTEVYNKTVVFECCGENCAKKDASCLDNFKEHCWSNETMGCVNNNSEPTSSTAATSSSSSTPSVTSTTSTPTSDISTKTSTDAGTTISGDETTATTVQTTSTEATTITTTDSLPVKCEQGICLEGECFFQDYCYFIAILPDPVLNATQALQFCSENGSLARGAAVNSIEENNFVKHLVQQYDVGELILTAGVKDVWNGWFKSVNHSLLQLSTECEFRGNVLLFLKIGESGDIRWFCVPEGKVSISKVLCERESLWATVVPELRSKCLIKYRETGCQGIFCCASDNDDRIWFECGAPGVVRSSKPCLDDSDGMTTWDCSNGSYMTDLPDTSNCSCSSGCSEEFEGVVYQACPGKYAYGPCPSPDPGYRRWLCLGNKTFEDHEPSQDFCCGQINPFRRQDPFLNIWVACPNTTVTRYTECFNESHTSIGNVSWSCGPSGFVGPIPDYSGCCVNTCEAVDSFNITWTSCTNNLACKSCPTGWKGFACWFCSNSSLFINDSPDYSACQPPWVDDIQNMINEQNDAIEIMNTIHTHLDADTLGMGLRNILNVTNQCLQLFVHQNNNNGSVSIFNNFTNSYIYVLDDFMSNASVWTQLTDKNKGKLISETITMTEELAYSLKKLVIKMDDVIGYNESFSTDANNSNAILGIAYANNLSAISFGSDSSKFNCSVNVSGPLVPANSLYAAVAIIIPTKIASIAFPASNQGSKNINSVLLSLTVSDVSSSIPIAQRNLSMQVTFQHVTKARQPSRMLINRKLHRGETPSPIIGNSSCYFYDTNTNGEPIWNDAGCEVFSSSAEVTICQCRHLSSFSVLVDLHEYKANPALETFSVICSSLSIVSLIITLIILKTLKVKKTDIDKDRNLIGINRCICLLTSHLIIVSIMDKKFFNISDDTCSIVAGVLHYALMAAFSWMSIEAYHLYHLVVLVFTRERSCRSHYFIIGYLFPFIPIMLTELASQVMQTRAYGRDEICWLESAFIWSFDGPVFFLTSMNLVVIFIAMRAAITKRDNSSFKTWWVWGKGLISLCTLLGITWLIALFYIDWDGEFPILDYIFILFNGLQGVYIFVFQCILNNQVRTDLIKLWFRRYRKDDSSFSRNATVISADSSAKTVSSSLECTNGVRFIRSGSDVPGTLVIKTKSPRRGSSSRSDIMSLDDTLQKVRNRIINNK